MPGCEFHWLLRFSRLKGRTRVRLAGSGLLTLAVVWFGFLCLTSSVHINPGPVPAAVTPSTP